MRKRLLHRSYAGAVPSLQWLDLNMVTAEISSEDPAHPIECALVGDDLDGWRAGEPGVQTLRIVFDQPQDLRRIFLEFVEPVVPRSQEFVLRWSKAGHAAEIVRQQWNFSPTGATRETEDYEVHIAGATTLELTVDPDVGERRAYASLRRMRLA